MQISRRVQLACVIATLLLPPALSAQDTEAQKKMRQALEQKMKEMEAQSPVQTPPPAPPSAAKPPPAATPTPPARAATPPPPVQKPAAQTAAPAAAPVAATAPAAAAVPAAKAAPKTKKVPGNFIEFTDVQPPGSAASEDKAVEALRQKMSTLGPPPSGPVVMSAPPQRTPRPSPAAAAASAATQTPEEAAIATEAAATKARKPAVTAKPAPAAALPPLQGPAAGINTSKEQRLQALLDQYRMDQITPEAYHAQRAKILAEP